MECPDRPAEPVTDYPNCNFFNENFMRAHCGVEVATHLAVREVVTPEDVVLEVGARYPRHHVVSRIRMLTILQVRHDDLRGGGHAEQLRQHPGRGARPRGVGRSRGEGHQ